MNKSIIPFLMLVFALVFTACSPAASLTADQDPSGDTLGAALLTLEGTDDALTAEQAGILLPYWQAYKALSAADSTAQSELQALLRQTREALTSAQLAAIDQNDLSQDTLSALMQQYGVRSGRPASAPSSGSSGQSTGAAPAGGPEMGGMPAGDPGMGGDMGGVMVAQSASTQTESTSSAQPVVSSVDLNALFADAVIQVLTQRSQA
jgi:hypothetical protein